MIFEVVGNPAVTKFRNEKWQADRLRGQPAPFHNEAFQKNTMKGFAMKALAQLVDARPEPVIGLFDPINPPLEQNCEIGNFCLTQIEREIARAENDVFGAMKVLWMRRYGNEHAGACKQAKEALCRARSRPKPETKFRNETWQADPGVGTGHLPGQPAAFHNEV